MAVANFTRVLTLMLALPLVLSLTSCSKSEPFDIVRVTGRVTLDGQPVANLPLTFNPRMAGDSVNGIVGPPSFGVTDENGHFTLTATRGWGRGAVAGPHLVMFNPVVDPTRTKELTTEEKEMGAEPEVHLMHVVPKRYRQGVEFVIPDAGTDEANFELVTK
ncbi:transthyretin-like family protein [Calycomorphotria hydatis]|uniref:Nickel uptake substrate-specific transmembrane region n=1 Tax=Calycomorphotria hydatis TaxID=2528027 RepID=A0A517TE67_9PLAN|nr:hypothetical protein [Calycomorphotria hydatis]QDT66671.1 hypothetical protein V22_39420 [Calycomorphotria hydatis]